MLLKVDRHGTGAPGGPYTDTDKLNVVEYIASSLDWPSSASRWEIFHQMVGALNQRLLSGSHMYHLPFASIRKEPTSLGESITAEMRKVPPFLSVSAD